jgi:uncharacterized protein (TIGR03067 family)
MVSVAAIFWRWVMGSNVLLALAAGLALAAEPAAEGAVTKEKEKLAGTWAVTSVEANGHRVPAEATGDYQFIFTADKLTRTRDGKVESEAGYRVDPSRAPRWMDFLGPKGEKQKVVPILYALEGDGLTLCFRTDYKRTDTPVRPTKLDGGEGSEQVVLVLKRMRP